MYSPSTPNSTLPNGTMISASYFSKESSLSPQCNTLQSNNQPPIVLVAKFDYKSKEQQELDLRKNQKLTLIDNSKNWWLVQKCDTGEIG